MDRRIPFFWVLLGYETADLDVSKQLMSRRTNCQKAVEERLTRTRALDSHQKSGSDYQLTVSFSRKILSHTLQKT